MTKLYHNDKLEVKRNQREDTSFPAATCAQTISNSLVRSTCLPAQTLEANTMGVEYPPSLLIDSQINPTHLIRSSFEPIPRDCML